MKIPAGKETQLQPLTVYYWFAQVKVVEFHAVQPWLAMADVAGAVTIWDWESQQVGNAISWLPPAL